MLFDGKQNKSIESRRKNGADSITKLIHQIVTEEGRLRFEALFGKKVIHPPLKVKGWNYVGGFL